MSEHVFILSIGPVQGFIAAGRKSSDLQYGSWLLSELARTGANTLAQRYGSDSLVFPASVNDSTTMSAPNKIVAVITDPPETVGPEVEKAIRQQLIQLRDKALKQATGSFDSPLAEKQVADLLEIYWAGVPFDGSDDDYVRARTLAERLLNARKSTRDFKQSHGAHAPKSSIDGQRESVIPENAYPSPKDAAPTQQQKAQKLHQEYGARPAERLSGVDLMKRLGGRQFSSFPSTSDMAAKPFLAFVDRKGQPGDSQTMIQDIKNMLQSYGVQIDQDKGSLVYPSRLAEWITDEKTLKNATKDLDAILSKYAGKKRPEPYYALLLADGDSMGAVIDNQKSIAKHKQLSAQLNQFAQQVQAIVKKHDGALIYAGGDDVMAYLPLHTALACAQELADAFQAQMASFTTDSGKSPTLSTGIVVVHHLMPLSDALEKARQAEKVAKSVPGKHALAITVSKRSGADRTISGPRKELEERLGVMIEWRREDAISAGTPYELHELHRLLADSDIPREALMEEALRIIDRKRESGGKEMSEAKKQIIRKQFEVWFKQQDMSLEEIAYEMIIAGQFASAQELAGGSAVKQGDNS